MARQPTIMFINYIPIGLDCGIVFPINHVFPKTNAQTPSMEEEQHQLTKRSNCQICTYTHTHIYTYTVTYTYTYTRTYTYTYTYTRTCTCTYMCMYIYIYVHVHIHIYIYMYASPLKKKHLGSGCMHWGNRCVRCVCTDSRCAK